MNVDRFGLMILTLTGKPLPPPPGKRGWQPRPEQRRAELREVRRAQARTLRA